MIRTIGTRRGRDRARLTAGAAATAALALVVAGCGAGGGGEGGGSAPGVTKDTIKLGTTQPLTGPAAPGYAPISKAMAAYFEHVNAEGGIHGRTIDLIIEDDGYNPTQTAAKTRKLVLQDKVFAIASGLGTPTKTAVLDFIRQNKVPDLMVSSGSLSWNQPDKAPYTFGWQTDYVREGKILANYAKEKFPNKTYCSYGQGDDLGADGVKGLEQVLGADALKSKQTYTVTNSNVAPQIGQLQAAGCEVIFSFSIPGFNAAGLGTAAKLGYKAQWVVSSVGGDPVALQGYLKDAAKPLTQGVVAGNYLPLLSDMDNSWIKLFTEIHEKYNKSGKPLDFTSLHGYCVAYAVAQALEAAGEEPTRESLVKAIEEGEITGGPNPTPFAYSDGDHSGMTGLYVTEIDNLKVKPLGLYTTDGGDGAVEEYTGEATEAPANGVPE
jgi:branched-chain amino acid transport system substrate-binding protein